MAKNWTAAEAVKVIREGKDKAAIADIGRRFPIFTVLAASNLEKLIDAVPDYVSARKMEAILKGDVDTSAAGDDDDDADDEEEEEVKPAKKKPAKAAAKAPAKKSKKSNDDDDDWDI